MDGSHHLHLQAGLDAGLELWVFSQATVADSVPDFSDLSAFSLSGTPLCEEKRGERGQNHASLST